jgi:hypothetical protein
MAGERETATSSEGPAATLKFYLQVSPQRTSRGEMKMITHDKKYPVGEYAQRAHDVLLVSSFAIWAMVLGFAPVLTYRLLVS